MASALFVPIHYTIYAACVASHMLANLLSSTARCTLGCDPSRHRIEGTKRQSGAPVPVPVPVRVPR